MSRTAAVLQKVVDSLAQAQALRPDSAEAWSSLSLTYVMAWRWKDAWIALNNAKQRDPTLAQTELGFALYYSGLGEADKVKRALAAGERLDPLNTEMADWGNWALFTVGESAAAREWVDRKLEQHPEFLRNDPRLEPVRKDRHYQVLLLRVGLDDAALASSKR